MSIAITEDHRALAETASDFLQQARSAGAARALLEPRTEETLPPFWDELCRLGWLGLHVPEEHGGSGSACPSSSSWSRSWAGRSRPGRSCRRVIASAVLAAAAPADVRAALLPGSPTARSSARSRSTRRRRARRQGRTGRRGSCSAAARRRRCSCVVGDDVVVVEPRQRRDGRDRRRTSTRPARRPRVTLDGAPVAGCCPARARSARRPRPADLRGRGHRRGPRVHRAGQRVREGARAVRAADRDVPGGEAPLRQHARRHRARDGGACGTRPGPRRPGGDQLSYTAAMAATLAIPAADRARTSTSRCTAASASPGSTTRTSTCAAPPRSSAVLDAEGGRAVTSSTVPAAAACAGVRTVDLPPEAEAIRDEVRAFVEQVRDLDAEARAQRR